MKKKQVLYTSLAALALVGFASPVLAEEGISTVSTDTVATRALPETTAEAASTIDVTGIANGDYSSAIGTYTNANGKSIVITADGPDLSYLNAAQVDYIEDTILPGTEGVHSEYYRYGEGPNRPSTGHYIGYLPKGEKITIESTNGLAQKATDTVTADVDSLISFSLGGVPSHFEADNSVYRRESMASSELPVSTDTLTTYQADLVDDLSRFAQGADSGFTHSSASVTDGRYFEPGSVASFERKSGVFIPDQVVHVRNFPSLDIPGVNHYNPGDKIEYDLIGDLPGLVHWLSYMSSSGERRFIHIGNHYRGVNAHLDLFGEFVTAETSTTPVTTDDSQKTESNPAGVYADVIETIGQNFPSTTGGQELAGHVLSDIDGNGTPELLVGNSANGFAGVYTLIDGKPRLIAQTAHNNPRGGIGIATTGEIVHTEVNPGGGQYETVIYRLRKDNSGVDEIERQSGRIGDGQTNIATNFTFIKGVDLPVWTGEGEKPVTESSDSTKSEPSSSATPPSQASQEASTTTSESTMSPSASEDKGKLTVSSSPAQQLTTTKSSSSAPSQSLSRVEAAKQSKFEFKLPSTGEAFSYLGLAGLGSLGLAAVLKRRKK